MTATNMCSNFGGFRCRSPLKKAEQKTGCTSQRRRKSLRSMELATEQGHIAQEGITYESGTF